MALPVLPFAVCFQVEPAAEGTDAYLSFAGQLRPELDRMRGFLSIERSGAVEGARGLLSLSYWADEAAVAAWRSHPDHQRAQEAGHKDLFADYRLRVGQVVRRWRPAHNVVIEPPRDERSFLGITRIEGPPDQVAAFRTEIADRFKEAAVYRSLSSGNRIFVVAGLADAAAALRLEDDLARAFASPSLEAVHDTCAIERDYGRFERAQAPGISL